MTPVILVLNAGSSSLKFRLYNENLDECANGRVTGLGSKPQFKVEDIFEKTLPQGTTQDQALEHILNWLNDHPEWGLKAVGHRIVHGGDFYDGPVLLDEESIAKLETLTSLAPLHQPHNLAPIKRLRRLYPDVLQIGCFDTAFHKRQDKLHKIYALPDSYFEKGIKRYGFHGLSYEWITQHLQEQQPALHNKRIIAAHLGNGASLCAIKNGQSVATTMGMTAIEGLPMGTRSGSIDPGAVLFMARELNMSIDDIDHLLSYKAGLEGLSGISNDMRVLRKSDDPKAKLAIEYFTLKVAENIARLAVTIGGMDALVFSGGIGENDTILHKDLSKQLNFMPEFESIIIPANEEKVIASAVKGYLKQ